MVTAGLVIGECKLVFCNFSEEKIFFGCLLEWRGFLSVADWNVRIVGCFECFVVGILKWRGFGMDLGAWVARKSGVGNAAVQDALGVLSFSVYAHSYP